MAEETANMGIGVGAPTGTGAVLRVYQIKDSGVKVAFSDKPAETGDAAFSWSPTASQPVDLEATAIRSGSYCPPPPMTDAAHDHKVPYGGLEVRCVEDIETDRLCDSRYYLREMMKA